jgi:nucleotide-binding universal stress UspA family protein
MACLLLKDNDRSDWESLSLYQVISFRKREPMVNQFKIMSAVDLSRYSEATVLYSQMLARELKAEMVMVTVINQPELDIVQRAMAGYGSFSFPDYLLEQIQERESRMKDLFESGSPGTIRCQYLVQQGIPYQEILKAIDKEKPNMLVLSTKGRSNIADVVMGSTARKIFRRSPIPMVIIPAGYDVLP